MVRRSSWSRASRSGSGLPWGGRRGRSGLTPDGGGLRSRCTKSSRHRRNNRHGRNTRTCTTQAQHCLENLQLEAGTDLMWCPEGTRPRKVSRPSRPSVQCSFREQVVQGEGKGVKGGEGVGVEGGEGEGPEPATELLFSYYSHLIYVISHILFTRPIGKTGQ